MRTDQVLAHFGSRRAVANALGLSRAAIYLWGPVVPYASAKRLTELVPGLMIEPDLYDDRLRPIAEKNQRARR